MAHFDFHFHLLFKHAIAQDGISVSDNIEVKGLANILNAIFGGPFESQSSPKMVMQSQLYFGVIATLSLEHAFIRRMFSFPGFKLEKALPLNNKLIREIRDGKTTYNKIFNDQLDFTVKSITDNAAWNINLINRSADTTAAQSALETALADPAVYKGTRWFALSIEGGHNLSEVLVRGTDIHQTPEATLKSLQDRDDVDFISINLCHLSYIPELHLGTFAQGLNKTAQIAFNSEDFHPTVGLGLTPLGRKVIRQALTHEKKPVLIDVKHMSLYTRLQYYRYKEKLDNDHAEVKRLPIISSHTGFTFNTIAEYIGEQQYEAALSVGEAGKPVSRITPRERRIGRTDDWFNSGLHCNPWTINLFDEEIEVILRSGGMIGISLDQRVLGTENMAADSARGKRYEAEHVTREEYEKLFRDRQLPATESLLGDLWRGITPPQPRERHSMLLAAHLVHAVRIGYAAGLNGITERGDDTPWDYVCIGSDFDGLINPINAVKNVIDLPNLKIELRKYLPQADRTLPFRTDIKALRYDRNGHPDAAYLNDVIEKVIITNGLQFLKRFVNNWK